MLVQAGAAIVRGAKHGREAVRASGCLARASRRHGWAPGLAAIALMVGLAATSASRSETGVRRGEGEGRMALTLTSPSFRHQEEIPAKYTCEGEDVSPALAWSGVPAGTKSLVLIVDDPDAPDPKAPRMTWVHWVLFDIPPDATGLPEAIEHAALPRGTREGQNDWKRSGYGGPCPPIGRHRYFHKLYALDVTLGDRGAATKAELETAMKGHVLASAELIGTYQKKQ